MLRDLRFSLRLMRRHPAFTGLATACIALGIGVTTTIFTAVSALLLRPLPFANADRLVVMHSRDVVRDRGVSGEVAWGDFVVWQRESRAFAAMGTFSSGPVDVIAPGGDTTTAVVGTISPGVLPALGLMPVIGRGFENRDQTFGNQFVVILSHGYWMRHFSARTDVVGELIRLDMRPARPYRIVGVLPPRRTFPEGVEMYVPLQVDADEFDRHDRRQAQGAIGLLAPGVTLDEARSEVVRLSRRLQTTFPSENGSREASVVSLRDELVGARRLPVLLLLGAGAAVLLIACANVANLTMARASTRTCEIGVRLAIGAGRWRVCRQLLTESLTLATVGGAAGILLAYFGSRALVVLLPDGLPEYATAAIDTRVLLFSAALTVATGVIFGTVPALRETGTLGAGRADTSRGSNVLRNTLVVVEIMLSFVLVTGTALVIRTIVAIDSELPVDRRVIWVSVPTPASRYEGARREAFFEDLVGRVRTLPGVQSVGRAAIRPPLAAGSQARVPIVLEGDAGAVETVRLAAVAEVDPSYLPTLGVPVQRGRMFTDADRPLDLQARQFVAIVNETFANSFLTGRDPLGQRIRSTLPGASSLGAVTFTIVGVARDFRQERPPAPIAPAIFAYVPLGSSNTPLVIRASADPDAVWQSVRDVVRQMDPEVRVTVAQTFEQSIERGLVQERMYQRALGVFALLALGMAVVGIYGVVSYTVAQRHREFGVRVALGATPGRLLGHVLGQGTRVIVAGLVLGAAAASLVTRVLSSVLYGVRPNDPATFAGVAIVIATVSCVAMIAPARRASRADPIVTLKAD